MECVEYASNDFVDKIEVIAGRSRHFKLNCLIPDQKSDFSSLASFTKTWMIAMIKFDQFLLKKKWKPCVVKRTIFVEQKLYLALQLQTYRVIQGQCLQGFVSADILHLSEFFIFANQFVSNWQCFRNADIILPCLTANASK